MNRRDSAVSCVIILVGILGAVLTTEYHALPYAAWMLGVWVGATIGRFLPFSFYRAHRDKL